MSKNDAIIGPDSDRAKANVDIAEADPEEAAPGARHVPAVEAAHAIVDLLLGGHVRQLMAIAADEMAQRMTTESIAAQEKYICGQNNRPEIDVKTVGKPKGFPGVVREKNNKNQCEIKKITVNILQNQREFSLAAII